ncbi:DUF6397 family protein [Streptomyces sp. MNP-20]|uniref:DUF6397 family protein n=1 Tax=Streptomyces sp. MNP-20 TaxID=2721165 RepID=UPI0020A61EC5|nr:DUF6397 family protein [Streptomyces sp. MNP-20]
MAGDTQTISHFASTTPRKAAAPPTEGTAPPTEVAAPPAARAGRPGPLARSSAARELGLKRGEFELAVMLGRVRTVPDPAGVRRRVSREEIDRVRETPGFPESLRDGVKTVGTAEGAALLDITQARFTRLARTGVLTPVKFYLNRYRAVVWLYLAEELREFAACEANAPLLTGRAPDMMRAQLASGADLRARNWRRRQVGFLLRQAEDPWERVAVTASFLDPMSLAQLVRDPYERAYLHRLSPQPLTQAGPESPTTHIVERITTADDPDEISWLRANLSLGLAEARRHRPAPRPGRPPLSATARPHGAPEQPQTPALGDDCGAARPSEAASSAVTAPAPVSRERDTGRREEPRGLLRWLRRRRGRPED